MTANGENQITSRGTATQPEARQREKMRDPGQKQAASRRPQIQNLSTRNPSRAKNARLIDLLKCDDGIDIQALSSALGWQCHTTRAALTRLRQRGHRLETLASINGGNKRYRIIVVPVQEDNM